MLISCLLGCAPNNSDKVGSEAAVDPQSKQTVELPAASDIAYASIDQLRDQIQSGELGVAQPTELALVRIAELDDSGPNLNAVSQLAPGAQRKAQTMGFDAGKPLAGIPFVVKANIDLGPPLHTHAGSRALAHRQASDPASLVVALQDAGAILVGTANMSEWANFRSTKSVSGWSSVGGQTKNPHVLDRNPCGSSSGSAVAVAAGLVPLAIGTETLGSIVCPAGINGVVGLKPTLGLISRDGLIPIATSQDTAGPFTRSVRGAAMALQVLAGPQPGDPYAEGYTTSRDYVAGLEQAKLEGMRVGVWRAYEGAQAHPQVAGVVDEVVETLTQGGAMVVDPIGLYLDRSMYEASFTVMMHEFKHGLTNYFGRDNVLREVMAYNKANAAEMMPWFGQDLFTMVQASDLSQAQYQGALAAGKGAMTERLDDLFEKFDLDIIMAPTNSPAWVTDYALGDRFGVSSSALAALSGRPAISIPAGQIHQLPIGISLVGKMWRDDELLAAAFALEQKLPKPSRPKFLESLQKAN